MLLSNKITSNFKDMAYFTNSLKKNLMQLKKNWHQRYFGQIIYYITLLGPILTI